MSHLKLFKKHLCNRCKRKYNSYMTYTSKDQKICEREDCRTYLEDLRKKTEADSRLRQNYK